MTKVCLTEDKIAVVVVASYRSVLRNPVRFKAQLYINKFDFPCGALSQEHQAKCSKLNVALKITETRFNLTRHGLFWGPSVLFGGVGEGMMV